jgi:hypothetical protein
LQSGWRGEGKKNRTAWKLPSGFCNGGREGAAPPFLFEFPKSRGKLLKFYEEISCAPIAFTKKPAILG